MEGSEKKWMDINNREEQRQNYNIWKRNRNKQWKSMGMNGHDKASKPRILYLRPFLNDFENEKKNDKYINRNE